jgi:spermidine synthase
MPLLHLSLLALLFVCSGFSALIYQIVWLRLLSLVFGVTVFAASAVLTSFMGGLALGSWLGGRLADRVRRPLRAFAIVELGVAASALAVPLALGGAQALYDLLYRQSPDAIVPLTIARLACSAVVLLVPTTLMGASLPLLSRHVASSTTNAARRIGFLYSANTGGAILGSSLAGFVLIGGIGIARSTRLAAAINILVGLGALVLEARSARVTGATPPADPSPSSPARAGRRAVLAVFALAGFAGLALEVVWFRVLLLFLPATTYAFTTMLSTVLFGIALGSLVAADLVERSPDPARGLARIQIASGVLVVSSMAGLAHAYRLGWLDTTTALLPACIVALLPATTLMGATFPFGLEVWLKDDRAHVGARVGVLYSVNVCGAVAGSLAGAFLLLPFLGSRASLVLLAGVYVVSGCLLVASAYGRRALVRVALMAGVALAAGSAAVPDLFAAVIARRYGHGERQVFRSEGVQTTATVHRQPAGTLVLYLDGLHQANDTSQMVRIHAEIGHLPMILHPSPSRALVIGLGGGVTAGSVAEHRRVATDVVELARSVVLAAPFFAHVNGHVLEQPNVRLRTDDGRNYLLLTPRRYDVVTADIIQPIHAGAGNLYSREYFTLARRVLKENGVMLQWIGHREEVHYKLIMRTFLEVFPNATLWSNGTLMVGSLQPLTISRAAYARRVADTDTRFALMQVGLDTFEALLARYTAGPDEMRRFVGEGPVLTDDRPLLEYHRSIDGGRAVDVSSLRGDVTPRVRP